MLHNKFCEFCSKSFIASTQEEQRGNSKYCSRQCFWSARKESTKKKREENPNTICASCQKNFWRKISSNKGRSKSGLRFCSRSCKDLAQGIKGLLKPPHYGTSSHQDYRYIAFSFKPKICERCGYNENAAAIIVHHRDRNRLNNSLENLEVLCSNCHAIEHWSEEQRKSLITP